MKKIPTLFVREFVNGHVVKIKDEVAPGLGWILAVPYVIPTIKYDGSCCMIRREGDEGDDVLYKRFDAKAGRKIPEGAIPCQPEPDPVTGHWPHWVKCSPSNPADKWFFEAYNSRYTDIHPYDWTYEAVGNHFNGNPYHLNYDFLIPHASITLRTLRMSFDGIREYLEHNPVEGIVFWYEGQPVAKIKRSDFGFDWPVPFKIWREIDELDDQK